MEDRPNLVPGKKYLLNLETREDLACLFLERCRVMNLHPGPKDQSNSEQINPYCFLNIVKYALWLMKEIHVFLLTLLNLSLPEQQVKFPSTALELDHTVVLRAESPRNFRVIF